MAAVLAGHDEARSGRINQVCADYRDICRDHAPAMSRGQWCAVMDATNGLFVPPEEGGATRRFLWAEIQDCEGLGEKWAIDQEALASRIRGMSTAELVAVVEVSRGFWRLTHLDTDVALKEAGAKVEGAAA